MKVPSNPKILIVLMGAIGDVVRGLPIAVRIKQTWPESHVTWAVEPISRGLVENHSAIDRVLVFERSKGMSGYAAFVRKMRGYTYDVCLDLQRHFKSGCTSRLSGATQRLGFDRGNAREFNWLFNTHRLPTQDRFSPKIDQFQAFGDVLGLVEMEPLEFGLRASDEESEKIGSLLPQTPSSTSFAAMLLGSTWSSRLWFPKRYAEVGNTLWEERGIASLLIGAENEKEMAAEICAEMPAEAVVNLTGKTKLRELVAVFERCIVAIGSDSGPMHIAAAVGLPVVSLWGATSPRRSGPYGSENLMLQSAIGCSPCYLRTCPKLRRLCMEDLPSAAVLAALQKALANPH